ncbi:DUF397 domain-containing protein [Spirillospora sp. NPDC052269]
MAFPVTGWRKSSYSGTGNADCVELAAFSDHTTAVRDSKDPEGPRLAFSVREWRAFTARVRSGELDL